MPQQPTHPPASMVLEFAESEARDSAAAAARALRAAADRMAGEAQRLEAFAQGGELRRVDTRVANLVGNADHALTEYERDLAALDATRRTMRATGQLEG